ncbi:MAG: hypothetical protein ABI120_07420 [Gemmatimonadaceae bacterium]
MSERRSTTAAEFVKVLAQDPDYQARLKIQEASTVALAAACDADEIDLVNELREVNASVSSVWDFVAIGGAPEGAVAILVRHLNRPHHPRIWEGIVRSLSTKRARALALEPLRSLYRAESDLDRRWVIANAIGSMARFADVKDLEGMEQYRALFRQSRKPPHVPPAV